MGYGIGRLLYSFFHIKSRNNTLADDAISTLKMLDIYKDQTEDPKMLKASKIQHITEVNANKNTHLR